MSYEGNSFSLILQFQQVVHQYSVVAAHVHAVEALDNLADDALVGVAADEGVGEGVVEGQLRRQVLHSRVEAVVVRLVTVQGDVRQMVGAEDVRHVRPYRLLDALDIVGVELLVALLDVGDAPVLPAVPGDDVVVLAPAHTAVEEEASAHEVVAVDLHGRLRVQDMHVGSLGVLVADILQRLFEGAFPELVVAERRHHGEFGGEQVAEEGVKAGDVGRRHGVSRHHGDIGLRVINKVANALQERREAPLVNRIRNIGHPQMQI